MGPYSLNNGYQLRTPQQYNQAQEMGYLMAEAPADFGAGLGQDEVMAGINDLLGGLPPGVEVIPEVEIGGPGEVEGEGEVQAPPAEQQTNPLQGVQVIPEVEIGDGQDTEVQQTPQIGKQELPIPEPPAPIQEQQQAPAETEIAPEAVITPPMPEEIEEPQPVADDSLVGQDPGQIHGDPHFVGADGGNYDVQGEEGKFYGIISDKNIAYNAKFTNPTNMEGVTYVGEVGFSINNKQTGSPDQIAWTAEGDSNPTVNGKELEKGYSLELEGGKVSYTKAGELHVENYATYPDGSFVSDENGNKVSEYIVKITDKGDYFDQSLETGDKGVGMDGVAGHGLWAQTVDGDGIGRIGKQGKGVQGQGAIEKLDENGNAVMTSWEADHDGAYINQYETNDLFDVTMGAEKDSTAFNKFDAKSTLKSEDLSASNEGRMEGGLGKTNQASTPELNSLDQIMKSFNL